MPRVRIPLDREDDLASIREPDPAADLPRIRADQRDGLVRRERSRPCRGSLTTCRDFEILLLLSGLGDLDAKGSPMASTESDRLSAGEWAIAAQHPHELVVGRAAAAVSGVTVD